MRIDIIRHGDPDYDIDGLTDTGKEQAAALADYIKSEHYDGVYSSPLGRAYKTATVCFPEHIIKVYDWMKEFGYPIELDEGNSRLTWDFYPSFMSKRKDFYEIDKYLETDALKSGDIKKHYNYVTESLDKLLAQYGYVRDGLAYKVTESNKRHIVLFCHFGVECVLLSHLTNISYIALAHHFCASPSSITTVVTEERQKGIAQFRCLSFGATPHLTLKNMEPSFSARFCEVFDSNDRH